MGLLASENADVASKQRQRIQATTKELLTLIILLSTEIVTWKVVFEKEEDNSSQKELLFLDGKTCS